MVVQKSERLLNLLIMLLVQRHYVSKDRIRSILYPDSSTDAFEKMFERDKEELRSLGVPIEVGNMDAYFDDEPGYRIRPDQFALPDISLTADEAAVIGLATRVWEHARLAEATTEAVRKLTALGVPLDVSALDIAQPRLSADEPSFDVFWEAVQERTPVEFDYRRSGATTHHDPPPPAVGRRPLLRPLVRRRPRHRPRRGAGLPALPGAGRGPQGRPGRLVRRPARHRRPRHDPPARAARRRPAARSCWSATAGLALRRDAESVEPGVPGPDERTAWDRVVLSRGGPGAADELLGYGSDVYVEEPATLRQQVVDRLTAVAGGRLVSAASQSGAKDQVARLLTLVPFLHAHGQVRVDDAATALGIRAGAAAERPQGAAHVRAARRLPGRPDRRRPRRARGPGGRRRDPGVERRLPGPPAAAHPDRGDRDHRRPACAAQRRRRRDPRGRRPGAVQARGGGGGRLAAPQIDPGDDAVDADRAQLAAQLQDAVDRGVQVRITYFVPSRDEESERVVDPRGLVSAHGFTYLDAWCHSAEAPRLFRLDRIRRAEVSEQPVVTTSDGPRDLADGLFARSSDTTLVTLRLERPARWIVEYYPVEEVRSRRGGGARGGPAGRRRALAAAAAAPPGAARPGAQPGRATTRRSQRRHRTPSASTVDRGVR